MLHLYCVKASSLGLDIEVGASPAPRLSTTSLASSSSSSAGTSDHRGHSCTPGQSKNIFSNNNN
jgi:hypothetical protein